MDYAINSQIKSEYSEFEKRFFTELLGVFASARYLESHYNSFSDFVKNNIDEIQNLADENKLSALIEDLVVAIGNLDEEFAYKNISEYPEKMIELTDYMPFEQEYLKNMADKVLSEKINYMGLNGEQKERIRYHFFITKQKLLSKPKLKRFANREIQYIVATTENMDLNKLTNNGFLSFDFKNDPNGKIDIDGREYKLSKYDFNIYAYYVYSDLIERNVENEKYLSMLGISDIDAYYKKTDSLKNRWINASVSCASIEQQIMNFVGTSDYTTKGKRLIIERSNCGYCSEFSSRERGLFNATQGYFLYNFKGADIDSMSAIAAEPSSMPFLNTAGFNGIKTSISVNSANLADFKAKYEAQKAKQLEEARKQELAWEQKAVEIRTAYGAVVDNKSKFNHKYFKEHGVSNQNQDIWCKIAQNNTIHIPLFNFDKNDGKFKIYSMQTIWDYVNKDGEHKKGKKFEAGAKKQGSFAVVGIKEGADLLEFIKKANHINICEGFATAMAINKITNEPCLSALDCGNLDKVVSTLFSINPDLKFTICADNDHKSEINAGLIHASQVVTSYPDIVKMTYPEFKTNENGSDWCDRMLLDKNIQTTQQAFYNNINDSVSNNMGMFL